MSDVESPKEKKRFSPFDNMTLLSLYMFTLGISLIWIIWPYINTPRGEVVQGFSSGWVILFGNLGVIGVLSPTVWDSFRTYQHDVLARILVFLTVLGGVALAAQVYAWHGQSFELPNTFGGFYVGVNGVVGITAAFMGGMGLLGSFIHVVFKVLKGKEKALEEQGA